MTVPWVFRQIKPAKARGKLDASMFDDDNSYAADEKWDGDRRIGQGCEGKIRLTGSSEGVSGLFVEKTEQVPHLTLGYMPGAITKKMVPDQKLMARIHEINGCVLDGECVVPQTYIDHLIATEGAVGALSAKVGSIMNSDPEKAIKRQWERGFLEWRIFDCLAIDGKDIRNEPWHARSAHAEAIVKYLGNPYIEFNAPVMRGKRAFLDSLLMQPGKEGIILKDVNAPYGIESAWVKIKVEMNADVVIMGFEPPEEFSEKVDGTISRTKYAEAGLIGRIVIGQYRDGKLWRCCREKKGVSGISDKLRKEMTDHPENFIGKVMEIRANGREPVTGFFRHPRHKRIRDDKKPTDCIYYENES